MWLCRLPWTMIAHSFLLWLLSPRPYKQEEIWLGAFTMSITFSVWLAYLAILGECADD